MKILEELYYGNVSPNERSIKQGSQYDNLLRLLCRNEEGWVTGGCVFRFEKVMVGCGCKAESAYEGLWGFV